MAQLPRSADATDRLANIGGMMSPRLLPLVTAIAAILISCSGPLDAAELADAKERWDQSSPTAYRYTISLRSNWGGLRIYRIEINEGALTILEPTDRHDDIDPEALLTMQGNFDLAEQKWLDHEHSRVTFNQDYGFIETVESDDPEIEDDSLTIRVSAFEELDG